MIPSADARLVAGQRRTRQRSPHRHQPHQEFAALRAARTTLALGAAMLRSAPSYRGGSASLVSGGPWRRNLLQSLFPSLPELANPFFSRLSALLLWYPL